MGGMGIYVLPSPFASSSAATKLIIELVAESMYAPLCVTRQTTRCTSPPRTVAGGKKKSDTPVRSWAGRHKITNEAKLFPLIAFVVGKGNRNDALVVEFPACSGCISGSHREGVGEMILFAEQEESTTFRSFMLHQKGIQMCLNVFKSADNHNNQPVLMECGTCGWYMCSDATYH